MRAVLQPQVLLGFLITVLGFGGVFAAFTYIAPVLTEVTGLPAGWVAPILLLFGGGLVIGNLVGGKLADRALMPTLVGSLVLLAPSSSSSTWVAAIPLAMIVGVGLLGAAGFATVPPLQLRVLGQAKRHPTWLPPSISAPSTSATPSAPGRVVRRSTLASASTRSSGSAG